MAKFMMQETSVNGADEVVTARLGAATGAAWTSAEVGKAVKLVGESRYDLCAAGDPIEAIVTAVESYIQDGYSMGSVLDCGFKSVTFDGLEATPGTGVIAVGDFVVAGTVVALHTSLSGAPLKVVKATNQPGTTVVSTLAGADTAAAVKTVLDAALVKVADAQGNANFAWRVVSLGTASTGAVGTTGLIERVCC